MDNKAVLVVGGVVVGALVALALVAFMGNEAPPEARKPEVSERGVKERRAPLPPGDPTAHPTRRRSPTTPGAAPPEAAPNPRDGATPPKIGDGPTPEAGEGSEAGGEAGGLDAAVAGGDAGAPPDAGAEPPGTMSKETVMEGIATMRPAVKECYEKILEEFPDAEGTVKLSFTIVGSEGQGHVDLEKVLESSTLYEEDLHDCLIQELRNVEFPTPEGGGEVKVTYPFRFKSGKEEGGE